MKTYRKKRLTEEDMTLLRLATILMLGDERSKHLATVLIRVATGAQL